MISKKPFIKITDALKEAGNYRVFNDVLREAGNFPKTIWYSKYGIKNVINWCSNDYLGMGQHKVVLDAMHTALDTTGAGSGGTRNISGTTLAASNLVQRSKDTLKLEEIIFYIILCMIAVSLSVEYVLIMLNQVLKLDR